MIKDNTRELGRVVHIDEEKIRGHPDEMGRGTVEQTLNDFLYAEADRLCNALKYSRSSERVDSRAGHYELKLLTKAGVSVRRVESITEALWGAKVSPGTISKLNKRIYGHIEKWRNRPIEGNYPYVYLDGTVLKRSWGGEVRNISVLVAIGVD